MVKLVRKIPVVLGSLLALLSLLFVVLRVSLPMLGNYQPQLEVWLQQQLNDPVFYGRVDASWRGFIPVIKFYQVKIGNEKQSEHSKIKIEHLTLGIDLWRTALHRQLVLGSLKVSGADLTLIYQTNGSFQLENYFSDNEQSLNNSVPSQILIWLNKQQQLFLHKINLRIKVNGDQVLNLIDLKLRLTNNNEVHRLNGSMVLQQKQPSNLQLDTKLVGNLADFSTLSGSFSLHGEPIDLAAWAEKISYKSLTPTAGQVIINLQGTIEKGQLQALHNQFKLSKLNLRSTLDPNVNIPVAEAMGLLSWQRLITGGWRLSGSSLKLQLNNGPWAETFFEMSKGPKPSLGREQIKLKIGYLCLDDVANFLSNSEILNKELRQKLLLLSPRGELSKTWITVDEFADELVGYSLSTDLKNVSYEPLGKIPGVANLQGHLRVDNADGALAIDSQQLKLTAPSIFSKPLLINSGLTHLRWRKMENGHWQLWTKDLALETDLANGKGSLRLDLPGDGGSPVIELNGIVQSKGFSSGELTPYIPDKILADSLVAWLTQSLRSGSATSASLVLKGPLNKFPFDENNGTFLVNAMISDLTLDYLPHWPHAVGVNGNLVFSGRSLQGTILEGKLDDVPIHNVELSIPYIGHQHTPELTVKGTISTSIAKGVDFIAQTPLQEAFGEALSLFTWQGNGTLNLKLQIPLQQGIQSKIDGNLLFDGVTLTFPSLALTANQLAGQVKFTEKEVKASGIKGKFLHKPLKIDINSQLLPDKTFFSLAMAGEFNGEELINHYKVPLQGIITGDSQYQANYSFIPGKENKFIIQSQLQGITSQLPNPLAKTSTQSLPTKVVVTIKEPEIVVDGQLGKLASSILIFVKEHDGFHFKDGNLHFGPEVAVRQQFPGLLINGKLSSFALANFMKIVKSVQKNSQPGSMPLETILRKVSLFIEQLKIGELKLTGIGLELTRKMNQWDLALKNDNIDLVFQIPDEGENKPLQLGCTKLVLPHSGDGSLSTTDLQPEQLANVHVDCQGDAFADREIGNVSFNTEFNEGKLVFNELQVVSESYALHGQGSWEKKGVQQVTQFIGQLRSTNINKTLKQWGINNNLHAKKTKVNFQLAWFDTPWSATLGLLSGSLSIYLDEGRFTGLSKDTEVKIGLGRLVTLLSVQSLPKRVQMNFSDLTHEGYYFDVMRADFKLKNGDVITQNGFIDGTVAKINVKGRIGLVRHDYDLRLVVLPHLTSSLPVVATIAGGPVAGLVTYVVDKAVRPKVDKLTKHAYKVTGDWDDPTIQPL